jgi:hypothetical protein
MGNNPQKNDHMNRELEASESRKKFVLNDDDTAPNFGSLPPEASELVKNIMSNDLYSTIKSTNPVEEELLELLNKPLATEAPKIDQQSQDLLRRMVIQEKLAETPPPPPPPPDKSKVNNIKASIPPPPPVKKVPAPPKVKIPTDLTIYETGTALGIQVKNSKRRDVIDKMAAIDQLTTSNASEPVLKYESIGVIFYFSEGGNLQEITFSSPFQGKTSKGLEIGDSVQKAIELYGQPKMRTQAGAIWSTIAVFLKDDIVTAIRLRDV